MKNRYIWKFYTYPVALFWSALLGLTSSYALASNYYTYSILETGQLVAAVLFGAATLILITIKTTVVISSNPFQLLIVQKFPFKRINDYKDKQNISISLEPNNNDILLYSNTKGDLAVILKKIYFFNITASRKRLQLLDALGQLATTNNDLINALQMRSRIPWATSLLIFVNFNIFILSSYFLAKENSFLVLNKESIMSYEYWRIITYFFVHADWIHLALNMFVLFDIGQKIEFILGPIKLLSVFFISGIMAGLYSLLWLNQINLVGSSGAIFGIFAAYIFLIKSKHSHFVFDNISKVDIIACLAISLLPGVSFAAHFGGLVTGWVLIKYIFKPTFVI